MLTLPKIDDRSYQEILTEVLERIPVHNPQWKNLLDSDPGVTILQLFAFMSENLLYRANMIPERNRIKFLQLLGVPTQAAGSAKTIVTFQNSKGPLQAFTIPGELELLAGKIPFTTVAGLDILPLESKLYYKRRIDSTALAAMQSNTPELFIGDTDDPAVTPGYYETTPLPGPVPNAPLPQFDLARDAVDSSLWIALLARSEKAVAVTRDAIATKTLTLGIMPYLEEDQNVLRPAGPLSEENQVVLKFSIPDMSNGVLLPPDAAERVANYRELPTRTAGNVLEAAGTVELKLPAAGLLNLWQNLEPGEAGSGDFPPLVDDPQVAPRIVTWIRVQIPGITSDENVPSYLKVKIAWVGINAALALQESVTALEEPGVGNGEPDQTCFLRKTPVITVPEEKLRLTVNGELWRRIDDLYAAGPEEALLAAEGQETGTNVKVFTLDRASGEIRFGDGTHGARPPRGAKIQARYASGGGKNGNVGIDAINKGTALPAGIKVSNPIVAFGGSDTETTAEAEKRIPAFLKHRNRLVTAEDFAEITRRTPGVDVGRADVLPLFHPELPEVLSAGIVTVMVIPKYDPLNPDAPAPDQLFLATVCEYLDPRRLVTTEIYVRGPVYKDIYISAGIEVVPGQAFAPVREAVVSRLKQFLSPLAGSREGDGWPRNKSVVAAELLAEVARVPGVAYVNQVLISDVPGIQTDPLPFSGLELPRIAHVGITLGEANLPGTSLSGDGTDSTLPDARRRKIHPIPLIPEKC